MNHCRTKPCDALGMVRRATRRLHHVLEEDSAMARLAARDCLAGEYRWVLSRLAGIYAVVDARLYQAGTLAPPTLPAYRGRGGLLAGDVRRIGLCGWPLALSALAPITSPAAYLGARYVVDGAQFGHRVIARSLPDSPAGAVAGARFWQTDFIDSATWRALCGQLAARTARDEMAAAAAAARGVFRLFEVGLSRPDYRSGAWANSSPSAPAMICI